MTDPETKDPVGEYGPWQYATGLALWVGYIVMWLAGVPRGWRMPVGLAAAVVWIWGLLIRRRRKRESAQEVERP